RRRAAAGAADEHRRRVRRHDDRAAVHARAAGRLGRGGAPPRSGARLAPDGSRERVSRSDRADRGGTAMTPPMTNEEARHSFKNQLTIIRGFAEILLGETVEGDRRRRDLEDIHEAAVSALALLDRMSPPAGGEEPPRHG